MRIQSENKFAAIDRALFSLMNHQPVPCLHDILASPDLCPYLEMNGIAGVMFYYLQKEHLPQDAPHDVLCALHEGFLFQVRRNMACAAEAKSVFNLLHAAGIPFLVLKGIALAEIVYPHFAMRTASDLDILVHKEDMLHADLALYNAGYVAKDSTSGEAILTPPGYLASLEYHQEGKAFSYVHLHWHLINTSTPAIDFIEKVDMKLIWEKSIAGTVADTEVRLLCPDHLIIYLCEHALRVGHSFDRLILICDIYFAVKAHGSRLDWHNLAAEAKSLGLLSLTYLGLKITQHYGGKDILNDDTVNGFAPPYLSWTERIFLYLQKNHYRLRGSSYLVYLALSKGVFRKARLVRRTFFPPRTVLAQRGRHERGEKTCILYLHRIHEIIRNFIAIINHFLRNAIP